MQRLYKQVGALVIALGLALPAAATTIDFEALSDGEPVTNQYAGLTFANATAITAGFSLNEFEFPPRSGANVVFDTGGPLEIMFADPVSSVAGYFTYAVRLLVSAFDVSDVLVASITSIYGSNLAMSGDVGSAPNELLEVVDSFAGISRVVISGDPLGGSFTLDDLTFERAAPVNGVPEPGTLLLVAAGVVGLTRRRGMAIG